EDTPGLRKSGNRKFAEFLPTVRTGLREGRGRHHGAMQAARHLFQPRREVDRRTDAVKVQPVAATDIAIKDAPDVKRHAEPKALDGLADRKLHRLDVGPGLAGCFQDLGAGMTDIADIL